MIDWHSTMEQTYEFYKVDPRSWHDEERLMCIESCSITRDLSSATFGSATLDTTENLGECYIRVYLSVIQNGVYEKIPLGTYLIQTPSMSFDGKNYKYSLDAYSPLIELKGTMPPLGYALIKGQNIMDIASQLCRENMRAPVVAASSEKTLANDFVANLDDTWLTFVSDLIYNAKYSLSLDGLGRVLFSPEQDTASLRPVWTYNDDDISILYPEVSDSRDLYNIPNVVEVVYSTDTSYIVARAVNDDKNSPISTVNRGREIVYRDSDPSVIGTPDQAYLNEYAKQLLSSLSSLEHTITYKHGYCPVQVGDCVLLNYERSGLRNVKAKVISQSISCETGCPVEETAVYNTNLWR